MFLRQLKSLFNWGFINKKIKNQPFLGLDIPAWKNRKSYLTKEEIKRVIKKAGETSLLHEQFLILLGSTGVRLGEFSKLKWRDVNRKTRKITFDGKTGKRPFELTDSIEACLDQIRKLQRKHSDYVFSNETGTWIGEHSYFSRLVNKYMTLAEVFKPQMGAHIWRHSFCTNKLLQGESIFTVMKLAGHSTIEITKQYIQETPAMEKPADYWNY